jgi:4-amino-4-deoxychorismate lyase
MNELFLYIAVNLEIFHKDEQLAVLKNISQAEGLFETILIKKQTPQFLVEHLARLKHSAMKLKILFPYEENQIKKIIGELVLKNEITLAKLNVYLTADNLIIVMRKIEEDILKKGANLYLKMEAEERSKLKAHKVIEHLKSINNDLNLSDNDDWLFYNNKEEILETTKANVFFIEINTLITPKSSYILPGVIRGIILKNCAKWGFQVEERKVFLQECPSFEEVFLTNSLREIFMVSQINNNLNLKSGSKVLWLQKKFSESEQNEKTNSK